MKINDVEKLMKIIELTEQEIYEELYGEKQ